MTQVTLTFAGISTLDDLHRAVEMVRQTGFTAENTTVHSAASTEKGARFEVTSSLWLVDLDAEEEDDG